MNHPISQNNSKLGAAILRPDPFGPRPAYTTRSTSATDRDYSPVTIILLALAIAAILAGGCIAIAASSGTPNTAENLFYLD